MTLLVNLPVAIGSSEGWTWFFEFSRDRVAEPTLWIELDLGVAEVNRWSVVLLAVGLGAVLVVAVQGVRHGRDVLLPAAGAALL